MRSLAPLASTLFLATASGACTRDTLSLALDSFFINAITKNPLHLAPNVKISSNGYIQSSINNTAYANITWLETPQFKIQALDIVACQAARYTVARENGTAVRFNGSLSAEVPALVSVRLALADNDGPITELEIINVVKDNHILFYPDTFEMRTPPLFNSSQAFPPGANLNGTKILTRKEIISIANNTLSGIQTGDKSLIKAGPYCPRTANGQQITTHCEEGDLGLSTYKWPVDNRRWIADEEKGVAFGSYIVRGALGEKGDPWDLVNEFVAVKDGMMREVRAIMVHSTNGIKAVWPEDKL